MFAPAEATSADEEEEEEEEGLFPLGEIFGWIVVVDVWVCESEDEADKTGGGGEEEIFRFVDTEAQEGEGAELDEVADNEENILAYLKCTQRLGGISR